MTDQSTSKQAQLKHLAQDIVDSEVCVELANQAIQLVPGVGNPDAEIVFIGEAPGKNEDLRGKPFVGAAGKLLNELLESIDLTRDNVYVTNVVKYRPPNNRDPSPDEKQQFVEYLTRELAILEPNAIVTLGRHALNSFLPDLRISEVHGQSFQVEADLLRTVSTDGLLESDARKSRSAQQTVLNAQSASTTATDAVAGQELSESDELRSHVTESDRLVVVPLYHPAAALYNGGLRQTLFDDFQQLTQFI